jgi:hypothetical protein
MIYKLFPEIARRPGRTKCPLCLDKTHTKHEHNLIRMREHYYKISEGNRKRRQPYKPRKNEIC